MKGGAGMEMRYRALLLAARSLFQVENLDDLVRLVLWHALETMRAEACSLYLPDEKNQNLIIHSARGREDTFIHAATIPMGRGIAGSVFQTRQVRNVADVRKEPDFLDNFDRKSGFETRAMLCRPMLDHEMCLGVLQVINPLGRDVFVESDEDILEGMSSIVTSALLRLQRDQHLARMARLDAELSTAQEIQRSLLPPSDWRVGRAQLHGRYQPARSVSGDFYAADELSDGSLVIMLGDVSGKGIPAALTVAQVITEIHAMANGEASLSEWVGALNRQLCRRLIAGRFVAATFLRYHPEKGRMEILRAGQFAPWRRTTHGWQEVNAPTHLPLGVYEEQSFTTQELSCAAGESWLLLSDGIIEGRDAQEQEYGWERFRASLGEGSPVWALERVWRDWKNFVVKGALHDDACVVSLTCLPPPTLELTSEARCCKLGRAFVESWAASAGFDDLQRGQIVLAADEAFTNVIRHAYRNCSGRPIVFAGDFDAEKMTLVLRDFSELSEVPPLTPRDLAEVRPGGLGLHYIQQVFDRCHYEVAEPGLRLTLEKALENSS